MRETARTQRGAARRNRLTPLERKRNARHAAAARWGKRSDDRAAAHEPYPEMEPDEAVLLAAIQVFARQGFDSPTVREIAAEAGVGLPTLYRFYPTKRDLYLSACTALLDCYMRYFQEMMGLNRTPAEQIHVLALAIADTHIQPHLIRLIHRELLDPDSEIVPEATGGRLPAWFDHYFATAAKLHVTNPKRRVLALISSIQGLVQFVPIRSSLPVLEEIAQDAESIALFALSNAFPDIDWNQIRPAVRFEPLDLQRQLLERRSSVG